MPPIKLTYITDGKRHLICKPFSIANLHRMAAQLKIDRCFFEYSNNGRLPHYDIPARRKAEIEAQCTFVRYREIVEVIKSSKYYIQRQVKVKQRKAKNKKVHGSISSSTKVS